MNRKTVWLSIALVCMLLLSACGGNQGAGSSEGSNTTGNSVQASGDNKVKLTFLNSKSEIQTQLEEAVQVFQSETGIEIEIITVGNGQSPFEKASQLYASGNPATILMIDPADVESFKDRILELTDEKWVADAVENSTTVVDGKVLDFPLAVEGFSFIYNKAVLDEAVGGNFDPASIATRDDLAALFEKIEATGIKAIHISPMDWSLGAHYMNGLYANQSQDFTEVVQFIEDLKQGKVDVQSNTVFNGLMDTFDLMMEYNNMQEQPLSAAYEQGPEDIASGNVGIWFMGNWAWPNIRAFDENGEYGFLPVPISNNPDDYGNTQIATAVTKRLVIDKEKSTAAQQEAAKQFLNWLVYEESGQDFLINKANIVPAFNGMKFEANDPLAKSIQSYMASGKTTVGMTIMPADHWNNVGASMQKYLAKAGDRKALASEIEQYWKKVK
ncbi:ABC transporter substrate-binding protein [Paenibacillus cisolokensis]|uniref:ABC transporter substrate-binding protein n=1 Tax=Paenibacillus cisolokensis TaxID=1658519 RepID=UPI003D2AFCCB